MIIKNQIPNRNKQEAKIFTARDKISNTMGSNPHIPPLVGYTAREATWLTPANQSLRRTAQIIENSAGVLIQPKLPQAQLSALPDSDTIASRINAKYGNRSDIERRYFLALAKRLCETHQKSHITLDQAERRYRNAKDAYSLCDPQKYGEKDKLFRKLAEAEQELLSRQETHRSSEDRLYRILS